MRDATLSVFRSDRFVIARVEPTPGPADQGTDAQVDIGVTICLIRSPGFLRSRVGGSAHRKFLDRPYDRRHALHSLPEDDVTVLPCRRSSAQTHTRTLTCACTHERTESRQADTRACRVVNGRIRERTRAHAHPGLAN